MTILDRYNELSMFDEEIFKLRQAKAEAQQELFKQIIQEERYDLLQINTSRLNVCMRERAKS